MTRLFATIAASTMATLTLAHAQSSVMAMPTMDSGFSMCSGGTCVWGPRGDPYIRHIPQPMTDDELSAFARADRKWVEECHPKIVRGQFGVMRYVYSKSGCEYGSPE